jgi:hypothetical protein
LRLPSSTLPDELRELGYDAIITGEDKRILALTPSSRS